MINIDSSIVKTWGTRIWTWNHKFGKSGHVELVFNFIPGHLGVLIWVSWDLGGKS